MKPFIGYAGLLALVFAAAIHAQESAPVAFPNNFVAGENWEWRVTITPDTGAARSPTRTVVNSGDGLLFQNHRGKTDSFKSTFETNPFFNTKSLTPFREWPLEVGKTWTYQGVYMEGSATLKQTAKVVAFEEVTVPAGKFRAYKIEYAGWTYRQGRSWKRVDTHWYAPSVKADVKSTIDTPDHQGIMELVTYQPVIAK